MVMEWILATEEYLRFCKLGAAMEGDNDSVLDVVLHPSLVYLLDSLMLQASKKGRLLLLAPSVKGLSMKVENVDARRRRMRRRRRRSPQRRYLKIAAAASK